MKEKQDLVGGDAGASVAGGVSRDVVSDVAGGVVGDGTGAFAGIVVGDVASGVVDGVVGGGAETRAIEAGELYQKFEKTMLEAEGQKTQVVLVGQNELIDACKDGNIDIVKKYIQENINKDRNNIHDQFGNCPVLWSSWSGHEEILRLLLVTGFDSMRRNHINDTAFIFSCWHGFQSIAEFLLSINPQEIDFQSNEKMSGFLCACQQGHLELAKYLVSIGCNIKLRNKYGNDALLCAATTGKFNIIDYLLNNDFGYDINAVNNSSNTALVEAAHHGHEEIVDFLLHKGCNMDIQTSSGDTAFLHACWKGHLSIAKKLIKHNCNTQLMNRFNNTAFDYAKGDAKAEIDAYYKIHCAWNRRKALLMVLHENKYIGATVNDLSEAEQIRNYIEVLGNRDLLPIIFSFI